jgi:RNA polymerase sigma-70 factor (ECF subfamily)
MGEQEIVRKAAAGDRMAFRTLVLENSHAMFRVAWRLTGDQQVAEDVVQEAFIKAWQKLGDFRQDASFRSWLTRITVNTGMDMLRKRSRREQFEIDTGEWTPEQVTPENVHPSVRIDLQKQTASAMRQLSDTERAAFLLKHYEGHSIKEIAETLEMTSNACKQAIFRAVKKMRAALDPQVTTI